MKVPEQKQFEEINVFGTGKPNDAFARYFVGKSFFEPADQPAGNRCFPRQRDLEPGCRNNWHIHHAKSGGGQILLCTAGEGWYQEENKPPVSLTAGTVITIPAEVKHWHGAKRTGYFTHRRRGPGRGCVE